MRNFTWVNNYVYHTNNIKEEIHNPPLSIVY
jgi:hypothetical protein